MAGTPRRKRPRRSTMTLASLAALAERSDRTHYRVIETCLKQLRYTDPALFDQVMDVWGDKQNAAHWLGTRHPELGGISPLRAAAKGRQAEVRQILVRLQHGIPG